MRLTEKHRPKRLADVVGQRPTRMLQAFADDPYACSFLFQGAPGIGKTSVSLALANELGCDEGGDLDVICASELNVDSVREMTRSFTYRPMFGKWKIWLIEELETLHPQAQTLLKVGLENLPEFVIVLATSNDTTKLSPALLQRFVVLLFESRDTFAESGNKRLAAIAATEYPGVQLPPGWEAWGREQSADGRFSLRVGLDKLQAWMMTHGSRSRPCCGVPA